MDFGKFMKDAGDKIKAGAQVAAEKAQAAADEAKFRKSLEKKVSEVDKKIEALESQISDFNMFKSVVDMELDRVKVKIAKDKYDKLLELFSFQAKRYGQTQMVLFDGQSEAVTVDVKAVCNVVAPLYRELIADIEARKADLASKGEAEVDMEDAQ